MAFYPVPAACMLGTKCTVLYGYLYKQEPQRPLKFKIDGMPSHMTVIWEWGDIP